MVGSFLFAQAPGENFGPSDLKLGEGMILVTGAKGMLGSYVKEIFKEGPLFLTDHTSMDITDYDGVVKTFEKARPKIVLHFAAATDVDACEKEVDWAYQTNVLGTQNIVLACRQHDALLVYVSTGGVFDGKKKEPYTEFDPPAPPTVYSKTKWEGEKIVENLLARYFIVRAGWMIGGGKRDKKFVSKIVALCRTQDEIKAVQDKIGTITYAKDLAGIIHRLIQTPFYGLYHVANEGVCSRYDIAKEIVTLLKSSVRVTPVSSDYFLERAPRGRSEALRNYKLKLMGWNPLPTWQMALKNYLEDSWINQM